MKRKEAEDCDLQGNKKIVCSHALGRDSHIKPLGCPYQGGPTPWQDPENQEPTHEGDMHFESW